MQNLTKNHNKAYYRMVKTTEMLDGEMTVMYGIEGFGGGETVSLIALSKDRNRIKRLVNILNECELEISSLKSAVDKFLVDCYDETKTQNILQK